MGERNHPPKTTERTTPHRERWHILDDFSKHHRGSHKIDVHIYIYIDLFPIFSPPPFLYIRIHVHFERQKERGRYRLLLLVVWTTTISRFVTITFSINTAHFLFSMEINATLCCVVGVFLCSLSNSRYSSKKTEP